jgi:hypothetical protein
MVKTYHAGIMPSITPEVIDPAARHGHLHTRQEMTMTMLAIALYRAATQPAVLAAVSWASSLIVRALAGSLNMPEAVLVNTCAFAVAYVEAVEQRATLVCALKLWRELRRREYDRTST